MKKNIFFLAVATTGLVLAFSCKKSSNQLPIGAETLVLPNMPYNYQGKNPSVNNSKAELGRVLFYDKHMSLNNSVSCGTCHKQTNGFADNAALSRGLNNVKTGRNAMPIQNLSLLDFGIINPFPTPGKGGQHLFWDNRENSLVDLMLRPVGNHVEMGISDMSTLPAKLNKLPYYKNLAQLAYGKDELTLAMISEALAHFNASIRTVGSRFDKFMMNGDKSQLTAQELTGFALFTSTQYQCNSCHTSMFAGGNVNGGGSVYGGNPDSTRDFGANIGLNGNNIDGGIGNVSGKSAEKGMFKIPDLHNVAVTGPYMHDGSKATLDAVLDHYSAGIQVNTNLDTRLRNSNGTPKKLNISKQDRTAIIAFLQSLTDVESLTNPAYANPFVIK